MFLISFLSTIRDTVKSTSKRVAQANSSNDTSSAAYLLYCLFSDEETDIRLIDWRNDDGVSPLCIACQKGHLSVVRTLVSLGASVDLEDNAGDTPLHYAASYGHLTIVGTLLHLGASAFARNNLGYSPSDVAFSFEVEQEIQNTVRSALEANKRLRSAKGSALAAASDMRVRHSCDFSDDSSELDDVPAVNPEPTSDRVQTPKSVVRSPPARLLANRLQGIEIVQPPLSISTTNLESSINPFSTPTSRVPSQDLPLPSPLLNPESSKALQRILARDQNAQAGFHASATYKGLVGPALPSETSVSPYSTQSKESGYFSSRVPTSIRRGRSASNEIVSGSFTSSSATAVSSPSTSPKMPTRQLPKAESYSVSFIPMGAPIGSSEIPPVPPLPIPPHSALPALPSVSKSSTSSFVNKLRRSGSSSAAASARPSGMVSPLDAVFPPDVNIPFGRRSLKHHASLADLRSQSATVASQSQAPPPPQMPFITKNAFGFGKSRTRSGT